MGGSAIATAEDLKAAAEATAAQHALRDAFAARLVELTAGMEREDAIREIGRVVGELTEHAIRGVLGRLGV